MRAMPRKYPTPHTLNPPQVAWGCVEMLGGTSYTRARARAYADGLRPLDPTPHTPGSKHRGSGMARSNVHASIPGTEQASGPALAGTLSSTANAWHIERAPAALAVAVAAVPAFRSGRPSREGPPDFFSPALGLLTVVLFNRLRRPRSYQRASQPPPPSRSVVRGRQPCGRWGRE